MTADPDWDVAIRNGFRPYHIHLKPEDVGVPQDEASAMRITELAVRRVESWASGSGPRRAGVAAISVAISLPVCAVGRRSVPLDRAGSGVAYGGRTRNLRSHNPMLDLGFVRVR
jgi:hypothetical protein